MIVMAMLAFFVFVSRYYVTCRNRQFEQSRWMIVVALLLFVVHYMCQMRLGWRQQGNDVGVLFNLLFYSPSAILLSWSQLNILRAGHRRWSFMRYGVVGYALMVLCIVAGVISNGSLHIGPMLYSEAQCICQGRRVKNTARAKRAQEIFYPESETSLYKCGVRSYLCAGK